MALRILLADDSMTAQNMGKKILTDAGFEVVTVSNGAAAVKKLAEATPDIAILDVYMPGYTGLEVCERLKSMPGTARVPVLLSVGKMEPFRPEDGMKVRADGVIIKPFEATDLVTVVDKLAERTYGAETRSTGAIPPPPPPPPPPPSAAQPVAQGPAEGLETFTPVATQRPVHQEPGIEFTSVKDAEAASVQAIPQLEPTVFPDSQDVEPFAATSVAPPPPPPPFEMATPSALTDESVAAVEDFALAEQADDLELPTEEPPISLPDAPFEFEEAAAEAPLPMIEESPAEGTALPDVDIDLDADDLSLTPETAEASPEAPVLEQPAVLEEAEVKEEAADWASVAATAEGETVSEEINLDLDAEMQGTAAVTESPVLEPLDEPVAPPPPPMQQAEPFLSPLGKTSFDELDAVMEQAPEQQPDSFVVAEELPVLEPIAEPAEESQVLLEETDPAPFVIHEVMNEQPADVSAVMPEELLAAYDTASEAAPAPVEATEEAIDGTILEEPVLEQAAASDNEVLDLGADAPAPAAHDPLAFYGLSDEGQGDILQNPADTDDEPIFSLAEETDLASIPSDPVDVPLLTEESPAETPDILEEDPIETAPIPEEEIVTDVPTPVVPAVSMLEEVAVPFAVGAAVAAPVTAMAASPEPESLGVEPAAEFAIEPVDEPVPEPMIADSAEEQVAEPISDVAPESAPQPALDEAIVNGMAGRVVDRVVDRLKPILTVMVEEILAEVKKN